MSRPIPPPQVWPDDAPDRKAAARLWAAVVLAPRIEVAEGLLAGLPVPARRLDPEWVRALHLSGDVVLTEEIALRVNAHGPLRGEVFAAPMVPPPPIRPRRPPRARRRTP